MLCTMIFVIILLPIIIYFLLKYIVFNYWEKKDVPFVKPNYIFGNLLDVIILRRSLCNLLYHIQRTCTECGYLGIFVMFSPALVVNDLEIIKNILIKDFENFRDNWHKGDRKIDPVVGANPFVLKGREWKDTRNLFTSQFTTAKLRSMCPLLLNICNDMIEFVNSEVSTQKSTSLDLTNLSLRFTGEAVMCCGYGLEGKSFSNKVPVAFNIGETSADVAGKSNTLKQTLGLFRFFDKTFNVTFYGDPVPQIFHDIIQSAVDNRMQNNVIRGDLLNHLMQLRNNQQIGFNDIVGHAFTFFLDGFQTSSAALSYALLELSLNPHIQSIARNEVESVLLQHNGKISFEAYQQLSYIENIVFETLRKYPIIAIMSKVCTQPYVVDDSNRKVSFTIEKGTTVFWSVRAIHYNPKYYPEPDKFDPDRFSEEIKQTRPKYSFLGFGDGPRICIGRKFAIMQIVYALAAILAEFNLRFNNKTKQPILHDCFHLFDVPGNALYVDFIRRTKTVTTSNGTA